MQISYLGKYTVVRRSAAPDPVSYFCEQSVGGRLRIRCLHAGRMAFHPFSDRGGKGGVAHRKAVLCRLAGDLVQHSAFLPAAGGVSRRRICDRGGPDAGALDRQHVLPVQAGPVQIHGFWQVELSFHYDLLSDDRHRIYSAAEIRHLLVQRLRALHDSVCHVSGDGGVAYAVLYDV